MKGSLYVHLFHACLGTCSCGNSGIEEKLYSSALGRAFTPYFAVLGKPLETISSKFDDAARTLIHHYFRAQVYSDV